MAALSGAPRSRPLPLAQASDRPSVAPSFCLTLEIASSLMKASFVQPLLSTFIPHTTIEDSLCQVLALALRRQKRWSLTGERDACQEGSPCS